jgi:diguanylate cyclase (GGDEF)-like protein
VWGSTRLNSTRAMSLRRRLARPEGIAGSARWLFAALVLASVLVSLPALLGAGRGRVLALGAASAIVLTVTWAGVYLSGRFPAWRDGLLAVAITGFGLASPNPTVVFPFVFAGVWFGALYGSTWRSLIRCGLYFAAIAMMLPLWHLIPGHAATPAAELLLGSAPAMVLTVFVGRHLAIGLEAREQSLRRDRALADLGSRMLAVTDAITVRALTESAAAEICAATPGLRVLHTVRDGFALRVDLVVGVFASAPTALPRTTLATSPGHPEIVADPTELDRAAGAGLEWTCLQLDDDQGDGWTLIGAPKRTPDSAILAVRSLMVMMALALRNSEVHRELSVWARVDSLTGLANRAAFDAALADALREPATLHPVHLLFLDLDDFKDVNDLLGHRAGDEVLTSVAGRLRTCMRADDVCARLGGDEFGVLLTDTPAHTATEIAQRMVRALNEPFGIGGRHTAQIGASIGLTAARGAAEPGSGVVDSVSADELCHRADVAMYAAKANGKGQIRWFDPTLLLPELAPVRSLA